MIKEKINENKNIIIIYTLILSTFFGNNIFLDIFITLSYILLIFMSKEKEMFIIYILILFFEEAFKNDIMRRNSIKNINSYNIG